MVRLISQRQIYIKTVKLNSMPNFDMVEDIVKSKEKSKLMSFLLAILLGFVGFHNFYIGRWKKGFIQFFGFFLTLGAGIIITLPWAWVEGFLILIGKYSLTPPEVGNDEQNAQFVYSESEKKVNPILEYTITSLLLSMLLLTAIPTFGFSLLIAVIFYWVIGGFWNKITRIIIKTVIPIYATIFSSGEKFLIRFSEYSLPSTKTRKELYRSTRRLSVTALLVLLLIISLIAQSNISMVAEGNAPDAVICADGNVELDNSLCDEYDSSITQEFESCDADCVLMNTTTLKRIQGAYLDPYVLVVLLFAPFITVIVAPIIVLRFSSLSIVDKKTRSMSPIGQKANDLTNVGAGFGSLVLFLQTAWRISSADETATLSQQFEGIAAILILTAFLVIVFYPLVWLPMLKFTKSLESHVMLLDTTLVEKKGIEVHELTYDNNELRITPRDSITTIGQSGTNLSHREPSLEPEGQEKKSDSPSIDAKPDSMDEHGFEWVSYEGENYYRRIGERVDWEKYQN